MLQNLSCESGGHTVFYCFLFQLLFHLCEIFFLWKKILLAVEEVKKYEKLTIFLKVGKQK